MQTGVLIVAASGGDVREVTSDGSNPHFGGRNDRLYVTRRGEAGRSLVSIDLNGEKEKIHANGKDLSHYEVSSDDQHFAFRQNYHIYTLPLPPGGKPLDLSTSVSSVSMTKASGNGGNYPHWVEGGKTLAWSLGSTLFEAGVDELFVVVAEGEEDGAYKAPVNGASMSMRLQSDIPSSVVAFTGARLVTMSADDGGVIEDGVIVIEGNRIKAVGASGDIEIPAGAEQVDVSGKTIIPGLIDAHAHGPAGVGVIPEQNWAAYATLALGVTTVHDPSNDATEIFAALRCSVPARYCRRASSRPAISFMALARPISPRSIRWMTHANTCDA